MNFIKLDTSRPLEFISAGNFVSNSDDWIHTKRNLDSFLLILGLNGSLYIQQEDEQFEVRPNNILLLLPNRTHLGYKKSKKGLSYYWCHFYIKSNYKLIDEHCFSNEVFHLNKDSVNNNIYIPLFSKFNSLDRSTVLFHQLLHAANFYHYTKHMVDYILTSLMIEISEQAIVKYYEDMENTNENAKFIKILEWIRINIDMDITVSQIANTFSYNPDYLSRVFKSRTGMSFTEYIHDLKISKVKSMLSNSELSVKEIAYKLGFNDEKYMMKLFKKHEGLTPTQYRNAYCFTHLNNH